MKRPWVHMSSPSRSPLPPPSPQQPSNCTRIMFIWAQLEIKEMLENFAWKLVLFRYFIQLIPYT